MNSVMLCVAQVRRESAEVEEDTYTGEKGADGKPEGTGKMVYISGAVYEGAWKAGLMEGRGTMRYANGNFYEGEWQGHT